MQRALVVRISRQTDEYRNKQEGWFDTDGEWTQLLEDILALHGDGKGIIGIVELEDVITEYMSGLLSCGKFRLAKELLCREEGISLLPSPKAEALVLNAAREFFDNANSGNTFMQSAYECLQVIPPTNAIREEIDLISATQQLMQARVHHKPGMTVLPMQVRLSPNRLDLVSRYISVKVDAHENPENVIHLAEKLGYRNDQIVVMKIRAMLARSAVRSAQYDAAYYLCEEIVRDVRQIQMESVAGMHSRNAIDSNGTMENVAWEACIHVAQQDGYDNIRRREQLAVEAMAYCPPNRITDVLALWRQMTRLRIGMPYQGEQDSFLTSGRSPNLNLGRKQSANQGEETGCHEFYSTSLSKNPSTANTTDTYGFALENYKLSGEEASYQKKVCRLQSLYRIHQLKRDQSEENTSLGSVGSEVASSTTRPGGSLNKRTGINEISSNHMDVLVNLARETLDHDAMLAVSYALTIPQSKLADEQVFNRTTSSSYHNILACYQFSLRAYPCRYTIQHDIHELTVPMSSFEIPHLYKYPSRQVVRHVVGAPLPQQQSLCSEDQLESAKIAEHYANLVRKKRQERMLEAIYNNEKINVDLFTQDDVYKGKALREMMMTTEAQTINNALDVAKHFGVPRLEMILAHTDFLLTDGMQIDNLHQRLAQFENELAQPESCQTVIEYLLNLHVKLSGTLHDRLLEYYHLYLKCNQHIPEQALDIADQLNVRLELLQGIAHLQGVESLDFKQLIKVFHTGNLREIEETVLPSLLEDNIFGLAAMTHNFSLLRLMPQFPDEASVAEGTSKIVWDESKLESCIYRWYMLNVAGCTALDHTADLEAISSRFEKCEMMFEYLLTEDLVDFVEMHSIGEKACGIPIDIRLRVFQTAKNAIDTTEDETTLRVKRIENHLNFVAEMEQVWDNECNSGFGVEWLRAFDLTSWDDAEQVDRLMMQLLSDSCSPFLIRSLANSAKAHNVTSLNVDLFIRSAYDSAIDRVVFREEDSGVDVTLQKLLAPFVPNDYFDDDTGTTHSWMEEMKTNVALKLESLAAGSRNIDPDMSRTILDLLEKDFIPAERNHKMIVTLKTQSVVKHNWGEHFSELELDTPEKEYQLFQTLLQKSTTVTEGRALIQIISSWTDNLDSDKSVQSTSSDPQPIAPHLMDCWADLLDWMVKREQFDLLVAVRLERFDTPIIAPERESAFLAAIPQHSVRYFQQCLLSSDVSCQRQCLMDIKTALITSESSSNDLPEAITTDRLLHVLLLSRGFVVELIETSLYPQFVEDLLSSEGIGQKGLQPYNNPYRSLILAAIAEIVSANQFLTAARLLLRYTKMHTELCGGPVTTVSVLGRFFAITEGQYLFGEEAEVNYVSCTEKSGYLEQRIIRKFLGNTSRLEQLWKAAHNKLDR